MKTNLFSKFCAKPSNNNTSLPSINEINETVEKSNTQDNEHLVHIMTKINPNGRCHNHSVKLAHSHIHVTDMKLTKSKTFPI